VEQEDRKTSSCEFSIFGAAKDRQGVDGIDGMEDIALTRRRGGRYLGSGLVALQRWVRGTQRTLAHQLVGAEEALVRRRAV